MNVADDVLEAAAAALAAVHWAKHDEHLLPLQSLSCCAMLDCVTETVVSTSSIRDCLILTQVDGLHSEPVHVLTLMGASLFKKVASLEKES